MHTQMTSTAHNISERQIRSQAKEIAGNHANDNCCHDGVSARHASPMKGGNTMGDMGGDP